MPIYYVTHPSMGLDAKVEAPSTEKARTTFLDYLERNGRIGRSQRDAYRRNLVAERLRDPEVIQADLDLAYDYIPGAPPIQIGFEPGPEIEPATVSYEPPSPPEPEPKPPQPKRMLIQEVALRSAP